MTGTGQGIGAGISPQVFLKVGDVLETEIPGIGTLKNRIVPAPAIGDALEELMTGMAERASCPIQPF